MVTSHKISSLLWSVMSQMVLQEVVEAGNNPSPGWCPLSIPAGDSQDWNQHSKSDSWLLISSSIKAAIKCLT